MPFYLPMPAVVHQFWNAAGTAVAANGKVYSYTAGTDTPLVTHSNAAGAASANPLILDAYGRGALWLDTSLNYKIKLTDSDDNELWTQDNVSCVTGLRHVTSVTSATSATTADSATSVTTALNLSGSNLVSSGGQLTKYNDVALEGRGMGIIRVNYSHIGSAILAPTTVLAADIASLSGIYRLSIYGVQTNVVVAGIVNILADWRDQATVRRQQQVQVLAPALYEQGSWIISFDATWTWGLLVSVTFAGGFQGTYEFYVYVERL